jgi:hypothetical protein
MSDPLKAALLAALGPKPSAAQRISLAEQLEALAAEQRQIAAAMRRHAPPPVARQASGSSKGGRPAGSGAKVVRVIDPVPADSGAGTTGRGGLILIGRGLLRIDQLAPRYDVQRSGSTIELRPASGDHGYKVMIPKQGTPRMSIGQEALDALRLSAGHYAACVRGDGVIVLERRMDWLNT